MTPSQITLPDAWMRAFKLLFAAPGSPTTAIDFTEVHFYLGIPPPLAAGEGGNTAETWNGQSVYMASLEQSDYCDPDFVTFLLVAHELVHVLQIQKGPRMSWTTRYVMCWFASGFSTDPRNCFEREAYSYANGTASIPGLLATQLGDSRSPGPMPSPYTCDPTTDLPVFNPAFAAYIASNPQFTKSSTSCTVGDCLSEGISQFNLGGLILSVVAIFLSPFIALATLAGVNVGMVAGAALGLVGGSIIGALIGNIVGALIGVLTALLGAALGALIGALIQDLFDFLFGGDSGGQLNLKSSGDDGLTFGDKTSFERTREQMALSLAGDTLYVAWTGLDAQINVLAVGQSLPGKHFAKISFEQSNHGGPGVVWHDVEQNILVGWVGTEGHLNVMALTLVIPTDGTDPQLVLGSKQILSAKSPADATPSLASANGFLYLAWIEDPNGTVHIWRSRDAGSTWDEPMPTSGRTIKTSTAALAFGDERLYVVWLGSGPTTNILFESLLQNPIDGSLSAARNGIVTFNDVPATAAIKGGPTAAYGDGRLYIAWTDSQQQMHVAISSDQGASFTTQTLLNPETSRANAGPALSFESKLVGSTLMFGWTGQG